MNTSRVESHVKDDNPPPAENHDVLVSPSVARSGMNSSPGNTEEAFVMPELEMSTPVGGDDEEDEDDDDDDDDESEESESEPEESGESGGSRICGVVVVSEAGVPGMR